MDTKYVYVVMGTTGEYSARTEWPVMAYADEEKAQQHVDRATKGLRLAVYRNGPTWLQFFRKYWDMSVDERRGLNPYDPEMEVQSPRVSYYYFTVPVGGDD